MLGGQLPEIAEQRLAGLGEMDRVRATVVRIAPPLQSSALFQGIDEGDQSGRRGTKVRRERLLAAARSGVFRLNIGLSKARYEQTVDANAPHDATALDVLMPHPVYSAHHWVCVLNPDTTWPEVTPLLDDAHAFAVRKHDNTAGRRAHRTRNETP